MHEFTWRGSVEPCLDRPELTAIGRVSVGRYGGNSGFGASKNEDAALLWAGEDWVFAVILDAHASSESADAVLELFERGRVEMLELLGQPGHMLEVQAAVTRLLLDAAPQLAQVRGETACLVCYQQGGYLMWLSIGDNQLYLLHPELQRLGQFTLTVRHYFEWIGERSSLALEAPCFATGIRQLRQGINTIALATDGLLEAGDRVFDEPARVSRELLSPAGISGAISSMLAEVHRQGGRDSATVIAWQVDNLLLGLMPSG
jgi:hypothetical protein